MLSKIFLNNLSLITSVGESDAEKELKQKIKVNVELTLDLTLAAKTDDLSYTIDYRKVYELLKEVAQARKYNLIEALANSFIDALLEFSEKIEEVKVEVKKENPPGDMVLDYVSCVMWRRRNLR
jgi:dihydroneopterin aldolase